MNTFISESNKPSIRRRAHKRFPACISPLHTVPLETAHIGHYRLLSFVPVDRCPVVSVAGKIRLWLDPPRPLLFFLFVYISIVPSDMEFWGFEILVDWV